jgi:Undecaprenyl-phosphate galactose phosphotransferase WbaP
VQAIDERVAVPESRVGRAGVISGGLHGPFDRALKRAMDVLIATLGLVFLSPLILSIAALVKLIDGGEVFYGQVRVGANGAPFRCFKFRTMRMDADECLARWALEHPPLYQEYLLAHKLRSDPRVTPIGTFLRSTSLDELPQLVNILLGEMSVVGPRPVVEKELVEFYGPARALYESVRPGLTGLWQVSGRSNTTYEERVALDEWYVRNWSFWVDFRIILKTFHVVLARKGAL